MQEAQEAWVQSLHQEDSLEEEMATPQKFSGLQPMGSQRIGHNWSDLAHMHMCTKQESQVRSLGQEDPWKKERATTPVFLPGKFHGQKSLVD